MVDIDALKQAEREAYERYRAAQQEWQKAGEALRVGQLESTGLAGHIVSYKQRWGFKHPPEYRESKFVVDAFNGLRLSGRVLRGDGTLGTQRKDATLDNITDLGPYKPEGASK